MYTHTQCSSKCSYRVYVYSTDDGSWTSSVYCGQCGNESECSTATAAEVIVLHSLSFTLWLVLLCTLGTSPSSGQEIADDRMCTFCMYKHTQYSCS